MGRINCAARNEELTARTANNQNLCSLPKHIHRIYRGSHLEVVMSFPATIRRMSSCCSWLGSFLFAPPYLQGELSTVSDKTAQVPGFLGACKHGNSVRDKEAKCIAKMGGRGASSAAAASCPENAIYHFHVFVSLVTSPIARSVAQLTRTIDELQAGVASRGLGWR